MTSNKDHGWESATWEGSRRAQLRASLRLTPRQRFEALEALVETGDWLAAAGTRQADGQLSVQEQDGTYAKGKDKDNG